MTSINIQLKEIQIMNKQDNQDINNQQSVIEDLPVNEDQATEVKGGPIFQNYRGIAGDVTSSGYEKQIEI